MRVRVRDLLADLPNRVILGVVAPQFTLAETTDGRLYVELLIADLGEEVDLVLCRGHRAFDLHFTAKPPKQTMNLHLEDDACELIGLP